MKFKWAVLKVLANWPDRHLTFAEIRREVGPILETGDLAEQERFFELGDIELLQAGLVSIDENGLQITDAGLALLRSLESSAGAAQTPPASSPPYQFEGPNSQVETQDQPGIFECEMSKLELPANETEDEPVQTEARNVDDKNERFQEAGRFVESPASGKIEQPDKTESIIVSPQHRPAFLQPPPAAKAPKSGRKLPAWLARFFATTTNRARYVTGLWRGHMVHDTPNPTGERTAENVGAAILALFSLVAVLACAAAAVALVQMKSLKTDIATLHRELGPLKERFAKLEQSEKTRLVADQNATAEKAKAAAEPRPEQAGLSLSREEIQLIRDFVKPVPGTGAPAPAINVGDPIGGGTIPLPSQLMEKIPKLLGARFTTRNGSIIIIRRDSRQVDAVLGPN